VSTYLESLSDRHVFSCMRASRPPRGISDPSSESLRPDDISVKIIRSARRTKTVSARLLNWHTLEVRAPASMPEKELQRAIRHFVEQALETRCKMRHFRSDERLEERASRLNQSLFGGALRWRSIRFAANQRKCFGSCSPARGTMRISKRLAEVPPFVLDYVIVHELVHLQEPNHSKAFWELVYRYDKTERARGYLMALQLEDDAVEANGLEDDEAGED